MGPPITAFQRRARPSKFGFDVFDASSQTRSFPGTVPKENRIIDEHRTIDGMYDRDRTLLTDKCIYRNGPRVSLSRSRVHASFLRRRDSQRRITRSRLRFASLEYDTAH